MMQGQPNRTEKAFPVKEPLRTFVSLLLMLGWLSFGAFGSFKALTSKNWPTATGTILSFSEVTRSAGKGITHGVEIDYSYKIDREEYHSKYFKKTPARGTPEYANVVKQYQVDSKLTVYYDPHNLKDSVVEPGLGIFNILMTGIPLVMIVVIVLVTIKQIRSNNDRTQSP